MDELRTAAAAFFRNRGKNVVTENEFRMTVSMDLRWMLPSDAGKLLSLLLDAKHVEKDGDYLRPSFDVRGVDVPLGFRPSAGILDTKVPKEKIAAPADDLLSELMTKAGALSIDRKTFIVSVNAIQKRLNVDIEVAALIMLREKGADISCYYDRAYGTILSR